MCKREWRNGRKENRNGREERTLHRLVVGGEIEGWSRDTALSLSVAQNRRGPVKGRQPKPAGISVLAEETGSLASCTVAAWGLTTASAKQDPPLRLPYVTLLE